MGLSTDGWIEGPGLPQSVWRYKWLVGGLVVLGIVAASLWSVAQPTRYEGVVRIYLTAEEVAAGETERTVISQAQFIQSPAVSDRVLALTGNRLTRKELEERLLVEPSANADFITIRALDTTPTNAAGLADTVNLAYRQIISEQRQAAAHQTIAALEHEQHRVSSEIEQIQSLRRAADDPTLDATEQAKRRQLKAIADKIEAISASMALPAPALQDKAAVPDQPVQPKPLVAGAIGGVVGLVIGVALAWFLAARRRVRPREGTAEPQADVADDPNKPVELSHDLVAQRRMSVPSTHAASKIGVGQAVNSLDEDSDLLYSLAEWLESQHENFPQITAERLRDRLLFDRVAVLLNTEEGLDLAGCVGWRPDGVSRVGQRDSTILNRLGADGARRIESAERDEFVKAGLLRDEDQAIVVAPLKHENVAFGVLLVSQGVADSGAPLRRNGNLDGIGSFARSVAPDLHAWLLLHKLREQLASHGTTQEQPASAVQSRPPSPDPLPPLVKPAPAPAESKPSYAEPESSSAKPEPPSTKPEPRAAKPEPPSTKPEPRAAKPEPSSAEPESSSAKPEPSSTKPKPRAAKPEPPSTKPKPRAAKPEPPSTKPEPPSAEAASAEPNSVESASVESESPSAWPMYPAKREQPAAPDTRAASSVRHQDKHHVARG